MTHSAAGGNSGGGGQTRFVKLDFGLKSPDEYVTDGGDDCGHAGFILRRRLEVVAADQRSLSLVIVQSHERSNEREKW